MTAQNGVYAIGNASVTAVTAENGRDLTTYQRQALVSPAVSKYRPMRAQI